MFGRGPKAWVGKASKVLLQTPLSKIPSLHCSGLAGPSCPIYLSISIQDFQGEKECCQTK